jgi:hypothetical protein
VRVPNSVAGSYSTLYCKLQYSQGVSLTLYCKVQYSWDMAKQEVLQIRLTEAEKAGFQEAADLAGLQLSTWVRERLRLAAIRDLEMAGRTAPFIEAVASRSNDGAR